jgi:single-strand DNA-binding protein
MAFSLNRVQLIGNLGRDAETRFTNNNLGITSFSVATSYSYKGKDGNWVDGTTWHNITAFNLSDYYKDNLKKGKKVYVEGRLSKKEYTDKEGIKRYSTDVILDKLIVLDSSEGGFNKGGGERNLPDAEPEIQVDDNDDLPF